MNEVGRLVEATWNNLAIRFPNIELDQFVVMPNHIHGIIWIVDPAVGAQFIAPGSRGWTRDHDRGPRDHGPRDHGTNKDQGVINHAPTLGTIIRYLKGKSTFIIHRNGYSWFRWHRNYYERIIRCDAELHNVRKYILDNPFNWNDDPERN